MDCDFIQWRNDLRSALLMIANSQQVLARLEKEIRQLGFDLFAYGVRHAIPLTRPKTIIQGSYPADWTARYKTQNYVTIDPTVKHGLRSSEMVLWSDALFDQSKPLWNEARDWGLRVGAAQPVWSRSHSLYILSVARDSEAITLTESEVIGPRLRCLTELTLLKLSLLDDDLTKPSQVYLSHREREVLQWTADGKSSCEIAMILGISESTVNFHHKNIQKKFGAPNKTQAAVYAAVLGLI